MLESDQLLTSHYVLKKNMYVTIISIVNLVVKMQYSNNIVNNTHIANEISKSETSVLVILFA